MRRGSAAIILIILLILVMIFLGFERTIVDYLAECGDKRISECVQYLFNGPKESTAAPAGEMVHAGTTVSEEGYEATATIEFPKAGGVVMGAITGDCQGKIQGTYAGGEGGAIEGKASASCNAFLFKVPARGTFTGTVSVSQKMIPISYTGSALGQSRSGEATLTILADQK